MGNVWQRITNVVPFPQPRRTWISNINKLGWLIFLLGRDKCTPSILRHFFRWLTAGKKQRETFDVSTLTPGIMEQYFHPPGKKGYTSVIANGPNPF